MSTEVRDAIDHALSGHLVPIGDGYSVPERIARLLDPQDFPAIAPSRLTPDEHRASGTRTQPNGPGATEGDE